MSDDDARPVRRKSRRLSVVLLAIAATGLIALVAIGAAHLYGQRINPSATAAVSSTTAMAIDERGACVLLIRSGQEVADHVLTFVDHPDGSTMKWPEVEETVKDLKTIREIAPADFRADIDAQIGPLEELLAVHRGEANRQIRLDGLRSAGLRIVGRCTQYAS
jgi:hypothetical protein